MGGVVERVALNTLKILDPRVVNASWQRDSQEDGSWAQEKQSEYEQHGGPHGYIKHLAADIREHGTDEHIEIDDLGQLQDGHHRVWAARAAGVTHMTALRHDR